MNVVVWVTLAWALLLAIVCLHRNWQYNCDDEFITMRYAQHLVEGHGPRWNLDGAPVEGYSSPLHMLLLAALALARIPMLAAARVVGFVSHAVLALFLWRFIARRNGNMAAALVSALVVASWPMLVWDLGGLEPTLFAATLAIGTLLTLDYIETGSQRKILAGGTLLGLAIFVRPDGALVAAVALFACLALGRVASLRSRARDVALAAGACALVLLPWEVFRLAYYHAALPNSYYAKVYGIPLIWRVAFGLHYWRIYAKSAPFLAAMLLPTGIAVLAKRRLASFDAGLWACIVAYAAYVVDVGGDHMMAFRFMVPLVPLMAVALVRAIDILNGLKTARRAAAVSLLLLLVSARQIAPNVENPREQDTSVLLGEAMGRYINGHWAPGSLVAINIAGTTAYFADKLNFIDMLGINDREIAMRNPVPVDLQTVREIGHLKGDGASVLARRPQYIIPLGGTGPLLAKNGVGYFLSEYELARLPDFWNIYQPCELTLSTAGDAGALLPMNFQFIYYRRRDTQSPCAIPKQ